MDRHVLKRLKRELSSELEDDLYVSDIDIADKLIEANCLSVDDWESINALHRPTKKVKQLVKCLGRTCDPLASYRKLCYLLGSSHNHLKQKVESIIDRYECMLCKRVEITRRMASWPEELLEATEHEEEASVVLDSTGPLSNTDDEEILHINNDLSMYPYIHRDANNPTGNNVGPFPEVNNSNHCICGVTCKACLQLQPSEIGFSHSVLNIAQPRNLNSGSSDITHAVSMQRFPDRRLHCEIPNDDDDIIDDSDSCKRTSFALRLLSCDRQIDKNRNPIHGGSRHLRNNCEPTTPCLFHGKDKRNKLSQNGTATDCCNTSAFENLYHCSTCEDRLASHNIQADVNVSNQVHHYSHCTCGPQHRLSKTNRPTRRHVRLRTGGFSEYHTNDVQQKSTLNGKSNSPPSYSSSSETSNHSSDSLVNTDISETGLTMRERRLYQELIDIDDENLSDYMDNLLEKGRLDNDDIVSVNKKVNTSKQVALLVKILCRPNKLTEHDDRECDSNTDVNQNIEQVAGSNKTIFYQYPQACTKDFWKTFDSLNDKVNNGHIDEAMIPTEPEKACITYFLHACDKLYHNSIDDVELLIEKANEAAERSTHVMQLKGEVLTASTWLYLRTNRLGKMHALLEQAEHLLAFMPGIWSANAYGWFYHDYARCLQKLSTIGGETHLKARRNYKDRAICYARKAVDCFKTSDNSDGPIGIGFAASVIVETLLEATNLDVDDLVDITSKDIEQAEITLNFIEHQFNSRMPPVLKASHLLNKSILCLRRHMSNDALSFANECLVISRDLDLQDSLRWVAKIISSLEK